MNDDNESVGPSPITGQPVEVPGEPPPKPPKITPIEDFEKGKKKQKENAPENSQK